MKQKTIGDTVAETPAEVQEKADAYAAALRALGKAKEKKNTAQEGLIEAMKEHDCLEVLIDMGNKRIVLSAEDKLHIKKVKDSSQDDDD
jgi:hypothetical protein